MIKWNEFGRKRRGLIPRYYPTIAGGTEKNHENLSQDIGLRAEI
jgi:hypothetical protein